MYDFFYISALTINKGFIMSNRPLTNYVGSTRALRPEEASFDKSQHVDMEEYVDSMWPGKERPVQGYSHRQADLRAKKWKVVDVPVSNISSKWNQQMVVAKSLVTQSELDVLINEQDKARKSELN